MKANKDDKFQYKRYHIPNLVKAIKVFHALSKSSGGLTQLEIMKTCSFTQTSVFRILATLQDYRLVDKNLEDNKYTLSKAFFELAFSSADSGNLVRSVADIMRKIRDEIKETTMLGVLLDDSFVMLHQEIGKHGFNYAGSIGMKCPMHTGAGPKAVLAFLPEDKLYKYLDRISFTAYSSATISNRADFIRELQKVRRCGYAVDIEEYVRGMNCVGVPVFDSDNFPAAAIWVVGPSERLRAENFQSIAEVMKEKVRM